MLPLKATFLLAIGTIFISTGTSAARSRILSPILIVPGSGNSLDVVDATNSSCNTNGQTLRLWLNETHIETAPECYTNQFRFDYTPENGYSDPPGVTVTVPDFGSISSIEFVGPYPFYYPLVEYLVQRGYTRDVNIRAAPYDWRLNPDMLIERGYFAALKELIERMYRENGNTKITLIVDSQGGPVSLYFLTNLVTQEWKDTYIGTYVPMAAAFAAGSHIIHILLSGPVILTDTSLDENIDNRAVDRTLPAVYWLIPHASIWGDTVLVVTPTRNYTASDYEQLFVDAGYPQGYEQYKISEDDLKVSAPNVPTHCIYGLGFPTPLSFIYDSGFPDKRPVVVHGDGDSVVNVQSLETCLQWADSGYPFNSTVFQDVGSHNGVVTDVEVLETIGRIVGIPVDPINVCQLPSDPGACLASMPRYFFNADKGVCEEFTYGGCGGNKNNFASLEECNQECNPNGCPPLCTPEYCNDIKTRRAVCTLPTPQGDCSTAKCRITFCHTCYYDDEYRPLPGDCVTCPYYPEVRQAINRCFKRWGICTRRANAAQYSKARGKKEKTPERFKCYEHPCI